MGRKLKDSLPLGRQVAIAIDIIRCAAWFEYVRSYLQQNVGDKFETPYAVGKFIQPETYGGVSPALYSHNMWPKYASGQHCPSRATLAATEEKVAGSTAIFDASVWELLNVVNPVGGQIGEGLRMLPVGLQESLYDRKLLEFGTYRRRKVGQALLSRLERQATGLDSLAVAVLLLKEACELGDSEQRFRIGQSLHRILLMTCVSEPVISYRLPLITYFSLFVFPLTSSNGLVIDVPICEFAEMAKLLGAYVLILEDHGVIRCENTSRTRERRRMLVGDLGMDMQFGFMPRLKVIPSCQDSRAVAEVARNHIGKEWGLSVLRRYGYVEFPPDEILLQMRATHDGATSAGAAPNNAQGRGADSIL